MALVSDTIPNLINGVSQQPPTVRQSSQCSIQENCHPSPVEGLIKRPGVRYVAQIFPGGFGSIANYGFTPGFSTGFNTQYASVVPAFSSAFSSGFPTVSNATTAFTHILDRGDDIEYYNMLITNRSLIVTDLLGNQKTVNADSLDYLASDNPATDLLAFTVADTTYILNKKITTRMDPDIVTDPLDERTNIVEVRQALNDVTYKLLVEANGFIKTYSTTTSATGTVSTSSIASALATALNDATTGLTTAFGFGAWDIRVNGYVIIIVSPPGYNCVVTADDGRSNTALKVTRNQAQALSDLPTTCSNDILVKILGATGSNTSAYWVKFKIDGQYNVSPSSIRPGVWIETVGPDMQTTIDASTMPHKLVREADGTFTFSEITWGTRDVGDLDTVPDPSFIGQPINDIFFFKNRFGIAAGESVIMSRAGNFVSFFPETITQVLDDGPIDVSSAHTKVSLMNHVIPYNEQLLMFSNETEFSLKGGDILTSKTVAIAPSSEYRCSPTCHPISIADNVFFVANNDDFSTVHEYYIDPLIGTNKVAVDNSHCPSFIPKNILKLAGSPVLNMMCAISSEQPNRIYTYNFLWNGTEKIQSSWGFWDFPPNFRVLNIAFIKTDLYILYQTLSGVYLGAISLQSKITDTGMPYRVSLDSRVREITTGVSASYNSGTNQTTFTIPFTPTDDLRIVTRAGSPVLGVEVPVVSYNNTLNQVVVAGDYSTIPVYIGLVYQSTYEFSTFMIRKDAGNGIKQGITDGRLQLRTLSLDYTDSANFDVGILPDNRTESVYTFSGIQQGESQPADGSINIGTGRFRVPVLSKNTQVRIQVRNKSWKPMALIRAGWEGLYTTRSSQL